MARGVAKGFLRILRDDARSARRRAGVLGVLAALLVVPAFLMAPPWGVLVHLGAVAVGVLVGLFLGGRVHVGRYQTGLMAAWNDWMEFAHGSESLAEVHRKVQGRSSRHLPLLYAVLLTVFWALELGLLLLALLRVTDPTSAVPVIVANGLLVSGFLGFYLRAQRWTTEFLQATDEMVARGEIGVWGVR